MCRGTGVGNMNGTRPMTDETRRPRGPMWAICAGTCVSIAMLLATIGATAEPRQDPLEDAFWKVCRDCHDPNRIRETRRTRGGWEEVIWKMIEKGALGTERDFELVLQYLLVNYGMVNMNQALAEDIAIVTGLSQKDAEAIVAYRKEHGNFSNFEALVQVPGIDAKALEARRDAIMF